MRWVRECFDYPLGLTAQEEYSPMSLVDSESVVAQIVKLLDGPPPDSLAYNLGFQESFTLKTFLDLIVSEGLSREKRSTPTWR